MPLDLGDQGGGALEGPDVGLQQHRLAAGLRYLGGRRLAAASSL